MRYVLVADVFPPLRSSGAVQLRDLSREFVAQGHEITVLTSVPEQAEPWRIEVVDGVRVIRVHCPRTRDMGYVLRLSGEFVMPFMMRRAYAQSPLAGERYDGVIWYSPTIFLGPIAGWLARRSRCRAYLIVRDIFPDWAVDMSLMGKGAAYWFLRAVAHHQYSVADVIGVQSSGNLAFFSGWRRKRIEVLQNWLTQSPARGCGIDIAATPLAGRRLFVYAGNMGVAQGMDIIVDLAERLRSRRDIGFLFVGRGSESERLRTDVAARGLNNVVFNDEIDPDEIPGLYAQCDVGLVALDPRHRTHNIPGKFLSYLHYGLPVLASVNAGNDLVALIEAERVGAAVTGVDVDDLASRATALMDSLAADPSAAERCRSLAQRQFSSQAAVKQIVAALSS
jgi:glycosyltransferase involved in cell wall biosynthesis